MEKFLTCMAALMMLLVLGTMGNARRPDREERERREIHRDDIVGKIDRVRVERDGEVRLWVRRTDNFGRRLEGRGYEKEVEIKANETHCWIFHDRGMREVDAKACEGKVMNVQWRTIRGREIVEMHEMRRPQR